VPALTTADGRRLTYRELGDGPPLVCHPGGPGIPALIFDDLAGLDRDRTLIELDPRGVDDQSGIRDTHVVVMPGVGHMPWVEEREGFRRALLEFLG
jgi:pimeloyl-ACP methyl ester carboxylesterase